MIRRLLDRLDAYGTDDPDYHEPQAEDRCPVCGDAVDLHPCWKHRRYAFVFLLAARIQRP